LKIIIAIEERTFADAFEKMLNQFMWTELATIRILHVITAMDKTLTWPSDECNIKADALLADFAKVLRAKFSGVTIEEVVLEGHPAEAIIDCALDWRPDLIIIGSHGKRGVSRFLIGSTASSVASHAPCSVLIVRPEHLRIERISEAVSIPSATP